jgi:hypothetical protein
MEKDCLLQVTLLEAKFWQQPPATVRTQFKILVEHVIKPAFIDFENAPVIVLRFHDSSQTSTFLESPRI